MRQHVFTIKWNIIPQLFKYYDNVMEVYHDTQYAPLALYNKINLLIDRDKVSEALVESQNLFKNIQIIKILMM